MLLIGWKFALSNQKHYPYFKRTNKPCPGRGGREGGTRPVFGYRWDAEGLGQKIPKIHVHPLVRRQHPQLGQNERCLALEPLIGNCNRANARHSHCFCILACVASVSFWFRSKERPRNGILGFGRARNETRAILDSRSSFFAPKRHGNACYAGYLYTEFINREGNTPSTDSHEIIYTV